MESTPKKAPRSKFPALLVVALALVALVFVIWRVDSAPSTNDAYASADTIDVVPEVSGRIVELAVTDNQAVKQGDLLFRIDPRPYEANLAKAEASLAALDKQIMLTQRSVDAQQFGADSINATVEKARAAAKQATDTLRRTEPLLKEGFVSAEDVDRARTAQRAAEADLNAVLLQAQSAASAVSGVDALVAQRAAVEADIALTKLHLEMATVRAPFDGRVISLKTSVGQFASAMRPIFTLIDTRHWYRMTAAWCWAACRKFLALLTGSALPSVFRSKSWSINLTRKCSASALRQSLILSRNNERAQLPAITGGQAAGVLS